MKRRLLLVVILSALFLCGCASGDEVDLNFIPSTKENVEEEKVYTSFKALGKSYNQNKDIKALSLQDEVYNRQNFNYGEYKEADFAYDLVTAYLSGDASIYDYLISHDENGQAVSISEESKERLAKALNSLKVQMGAEDENAPIYFYMSTIIYEGQEAGAISLRVQGNISLVEGYYQSLADYTVTVYQVNDEFKAEIL